MQKITLQLGMLRQKNCRFFDGNFSIWEKSSKKRDFTCFSGKIPVFCVLTLPPGNLSNQYVAKLPNTYLARMLNWLKNLFKVFIKFLYKVNYVSRLDLIANVIHYNGLIGWKNQTKCFKSIRFFQELEDIYFYRWHQK